MNAAPPHRANNFDFLRSLAAFLVIYGHSKALLGLPNQGLWGTTISAIGLMIFFSISGYLVTESWQNNPSVLPYFAKRSLRIFPGLALCVTASAVVLGAAVTTLPLSQYYADPNFFDYFKNCLLLVRYSLPGVFEANAYKIAVNGSLWSLPVEFFCYVTVVALAGGRGGLNRYVVIAWAVFVTLAFVFFTYIYKGGQIVILDTSIQQSVLVVPFFFVGSIICLFKEKVAIRLDVAIVLVFLLFAIGGANLGFLLPFVRIAFVPYIALAFGLGTTPVLSNWGRFGDFSYGLYLYAFPVQQLIVHLSGNRIGFEGLLTSATVLAAALAFCSWHVVERPALSLKPRKRAAAKDDPTMSACGFEPTAQITR